jgi:hypothetical protein
MRSLAAPTLAALAQPSVPLVQLIHLAFPSGAIALNSSTWTLEWAGVTYLGAYGLGTVSTIEDGPGEVRGLQFRLSGVAAQQISLALDGADEWQGVPVTVRTAILNADYQVVDAPVDWTGYGDTMGISEDGGTAVVEATAESSAVDLLRGNPSTYSDADQRAKYPADRAFEYVVDQADQPVVWPAKSWFYK